MLKSELEKAAREYRLNEDGPEGVEFEAGAKWALEWVQEASYGYGEKVDIRSIESKYLEIEEDEKK